MYCIPLNDSTEARYAEIARKMLETGNWITLWHDYGLPFWAKPPLSTWLSALSMKFFGINAFAARLPSLVLSIAILGLIGNFVKGQLNLEIAKLTVLILASSLFFFIDAGAVMTDPSLLFCTSLACIAFWQAFVVREKKWGYIFFASIGLGLLAKGPLVLVLSGLPLISWLLFYKQIQRLWTNLPWISGIFISTAIALPWYLLAEHRTPGFLQYFIVGEHFGRFLIPGWAGDKYGFAHNQPLGMIWLYFFAGFLPWSIAAIYLAIYYRKQWIRSAWSKLKTNPFAGYFIFWLCLPLLFFSFARNIIYTYSFTALPAAALLFSWFSVQYCQYQLRKKYFFILAISSGIFSLLITGTSIFLPEKINNTQKLLISHWDHLKTTSDNIIYWSNSKSYSAEFYAGGKVSYLTNYHELENKINQSGIAYLVLNQNEAKKFAIGHLATIKPIYQDNKKVLLAIKLK